MGGDWHIPTKEQWQELIECCTWTWTTVGTITGYEVTRNGKSIFLNASGYYQNGTQYVKNSEGHYWTSTSYDNSNSYAVMFDNLYLSNFEQNDDYTDRSNGCSVRGVLDHTPTQAFKVSVTGSYDDLVDKPIVKSYVYLPNQNGDINTIIVTGDTGYTYFLASKGGSFYTDNNLTFQKFKDNVSMINRASGQRIFGFNIPCGDELGKLPYVDLGLPSGTLWGTTNIS
jgi:hypothetical protein